jgi:hypothetical protein
MFYGPESLFGPQGDGPAYQGKAGLYWDVMPNMISAKSGFQKMSTETGAPMGTPDVTDGTAKVGGGAAKAEVPAYGGTAPY